jgi:flagellar P-ring protein precursor FlgI
VLPLLLLVSSTALASPVRVKDLVDVGGVRRNALVGYGLVTGLQGQGDSGRVSFTAQSLSGMLGKLGVRVDPKDIAARNVAAVTVTAELAAFVRPGARLDVLVSSLGDARSLEGGTLIMTPLLAVDGKPYAVAQGPLQVGGFAVESAGSRFQKNPPTSARVPAGAVVERGIIPNLEGQPLVLTLKQPDATTVQRLAAEVNKALGGTRAKAQDAGAVVVDSQGDLWATLAAVEGLIVDVDTKARIVISERTGTVVIGENVRLRPAAIAHGPLKVRIRSTPVVSQPGAFSGGETTQANVSAIDAKEGKTGGLSTVPAATTVQELTTALNALGVTARDLIAILQALRAAGALDADIEVL